MYEGRRGPKRTRLQAFEELRRRTKHITMEDTDEWSGDRARLTQAVFALQRDKDRFTVKEINLMEELILLAYSIGKEDAETESLETARRTTDDLIRGIGRLSSR